MPATLYILFSAPHHYKFLYKCAIYWPYQSQGWGAKGAKGVKILLP